MMGGKSLVGAAIDAIGSMVMDKTDLAETQELAPSGAQDDAAAEAEAAADAAPEVRKFKDGDMLHVTHGDWGNNHAVAIADEGENGEVKVLVQCREVFIHHDELSLQA